jgi:hypothetical protein
LNTFNGEALTVLLARLAANSIGFLVKRFDAAASYVAIPIPGELTGYIGLTEACLPRNFSPFQRGHIFQEDCLKKPCEPAGLVLF